MASKKSTQSSKTTTITKSSVTETIKKVISDNELSENEISNEESVNDNESINDNESNIFHPLPHPLVAPGRSLYKILL